MTEFVWEDRSKPGRPAMALVRKWSEMVGGQEIECKSSDLARVSRREDNDWHWLAWVPHLVLSQPSTREQAMEDALAWVQAHDGGVPQPARKLFSNECF